MKRRSIFSVIAGVLGFSAVGSSKKMEIRREPGLVDPNTEVGRMEFKIASIRAVAHGLGVGIGIRDNARVKPYTDCWSPAYNDVLELHLKLLAAMRVIQERMPRGQAIAIYPCGCSATGEMDIPTRCPEHEQWFDSIGSTILVGPYRERPIKLWAL